MSTDIVNLREQANNLQSCLENLRENIESFPDPKEARWLETMLVSSLRALQHHISQLERLEYRNPMVTTLFRKDR